MVSSFLGFSYRDVGCCKNSHTIHLPPKNDKTPQTGKYVSFKNRQSNCLKRHLEGRIQMLVSWQMRRLEVQTSLRTGLKTLMCGEKGLESLMSGKKIWKFSHLENTPKTEMSNTRRYSYNKLHFQTPHFTVKCSAGMFPARAHNVFEEY